MQPNRGGEEHVVPSPSVGAYLCSGRSQKGVFVCARAIVSLPLEYGGLNTRRPRVSGGERLRERQRGGLFPS